MSIRVSSLYRWETQMRTGGESKHWQHRDLLCCPTSTIHPAVVADKDCGIFARGTSA